MVSGIDLKQLTKEQKEAFLDWVADPEAVMRNPKHAEIWKIYNFSPV